jgi:antitoxin YefM
MYHHRVQQQADAMDVINFSETRANLKSVMDQVVRDRTPVVVSRKNGEAVVMVSLADWNAAEETTYLLSQKSNASRIGAAIAELGAGKGEEHDLIEP